MRKEEDKSDIMLRLGMSILPFLVFVTIAEVVEAALNLVWQRILETGSGTGAMLTFWYDAPDVAAIITGIAMTIALLPLARTAGAEIRAFERRNGDSKTGMDLSRVRYRRHTREKAAADTAAAATLPGKKPALYYTAVLVLAVGMSLGINILISLLGAGESSSHAGTAAMVSLPLGLAVYGMLTPFIEETIFRGITYGRLRRLLAGDSSRPVSLLLSALLFGIWHGNLLQGIYAFVMGLVFAGHYELSGNFGSTVFLHALINILTLILAATNVYNQICTPVWCACSLAAGVLGGGILLILIQQQKK